MKLIVKTLKGSNFEIEVKPQDTVADVKKCIESAQGSEVYPATKQLLICSGKVLKDGTTLEENNVADNSFIVVMLSKSNSTSGQSSATSNAPTIKTSTAPAPTPTPTHAPTPTPAPASLTATAPTPEPAVTAAPVTAATPERLDIYGSAASNLVAGSNLEGAVQQILDMGGGTWDRDTVIRALRAAFNNPERAVEYLYSGIPEQAAAEVVAPAAAGEAANVPPQLLQPPSAVNAAVPPSGGPNSNPLDLFPQGLPDMAGSNPAGGGGSLDFLRESAQFQALRSMVQANPQILQPMLQELGKQNPHLMRLIQEHQADFLNLINEPSEGGENNILGELAAAVPQAVQVTPEEREAIERLEAMGFERGLVLEVFFACNKDEELAANYLLDHINDFEE